MKTKTFFLVAFLSTAAVNSTVQTFNLKNQSNQSNQKNQISDKK